MRAKPWTSCNRWFTVAPACIVVDGHLDELRAMIIADWPVDVVLRLNTGVEAHAHEFVRTAGDRTKFGISIRISKKKPFRYYEVCL